MPTSENFAFSKHMICLTPQDPKKKFEEKILCFISALTDTSIQKVQEEIYRRNDMTKISRRERGAHTFNTICNILDVNRVTCIVVNLTNGRRVIAKITSYGWIYKDTLTPCYL